jgi:hypothetical protein
MKREPKQGGKRDQAKHNRPPTQTPPIEGNEPGESEDKQPHCHAVWKCTEKPPHWTAYAEAACAVALVLITATYTYFAKLQAGAAITAANAAASAANTANTSIQLDQRAWIGPIQVVDPKFAVDGKPSYVTAGQKTMFGVYIINSGKSPGLKVKIKDRLKAVDTGEVFVADYPPAASSIIDSVSVLQPGMRMEFDSLPSEIALLPEHIKKIREGSGRLYFYGQITYEDIFKVSHATHFCFMLSPDLERLEACSTYNDAN